MGSKTPVEIKCEDCGMYIKGMGLLNIHKKKCAGSFEAAVQQMRDSNAEKRLEDLVAVIAPRPTENKKEEPKVATPPQPANKPVPVQKLDEVCAALREGVTLHVACDSVMVPCQPYYAAIRRKATNDPELTPEDEQVVMKVRQAEAVFELDCLKDMSGDDRKAADNARCKLDAVKKNKFIERNKIVQYSVAHLASVMRQHVTAEQYRNILADMCEIDDELSVLELDGKMGNTSTS